MEIRYHLFDSKQTILAMIKYLIFAPAWTVSFSRVVSSVTEYF